MIYDLRKISHIVILHFLSVVSVTFAQSNPGKPGGAYSGSVTVRSAYEKIQLTDFDDHPVRGTYEFRNVDFGQEGLVNGFIAHVRAHYIPSGWIEIRLDSPEGEKLGMCLISTRDGGREWYIAQTGIYPVKGVHSVFLVFLGAQYDGFNPQVEWFSFTKDEDQSGLLAGNTFLPPQVPYLGPLESNFLGNGVAGAGGDTRGVWDYLIGPAYTSNSYIEEEKITISLNGKDVPLSADIKRAGGTGIFYSKMNIDGVSIYLVDFALQNTSMITRAVFVKNISSTPVRLAVNAYVKPSSYSRVNEYSDPNSKERSVLHLLLDDQYGMIIGFSNHTVNCEASDTGYYLRTKEVTLEPGEEFKTGFYHSAYSIHDEPKDMIAKVRSRDVEEDLETCILNWKAWLAEGIALENIPDLRVRDIVEANSIIIKMLQGQDGGIMATPRIYKTSFIRDTHNALRGLLATGHTAEAKSFLLWVHDKYEILKAKGQFPIPNAGDIGGEGTFAGFGNEENWAAETPALYILTAENYFKKTGDLETLKRIDESLRFSMHCQLEIAEKNGWKLPFNGDETESGGSGIKLWDMPGKWSMPSLLVCGASLRFFISYLEETGEVEHLNSYKEKLVKVKNSLSSNFWNEEKAMYDWYIGENGERSTLPISNYLLMPIYFDYPVNEQMRAVRTAEKMKEYVTERGFIPIQPGTLHGDFCGHSLGYLLYALTVLNDPLKDKIFESLIFGGTVGCWGTWSESYTGDGLSYGPKGGLQYWDIHSSPMHHIRPFESGTNIDAIMKYMDLHAQ